MGQIQRLGYSAFSNCASGFEVLDLCFDSLLDGSMDVEAPVRRLLFLRADCRVLVEARGYEVCKATIWVEPCGSGVTVEAHTRGGRSTGPLTWPAEHELRPLRPGLTTFLLHWQAGEHPPARTAWVLL